MKLRIDPRLKILYLFILAILTFVLDDYRWLLILLGIQLLLWELGRFSLRELWRGLRRVLFVIVFLIISTLLVAPEVGTNVGRTITLAGGHVKLYLSGLLVGVIISLRILILITGSLLVRVSGSSMEFVEGLRGLKVPASMALSLDVTLALLSGGKGKKKKKKKKFEFKRMLKGDFSFLNDAIADSFQEAQKHVSKAGYEGSTEQLRDVVIVSGITVMAMLTKFLKVMPGFPVNPGHKSLLIIPLYILANALTNNRWGATWTGISLGIIAYLFGEGQFGFLEIMKYVSPGILIDLTMPLHETFFKWFEVKLERIKVSNFLPVIINATKWASLSFLGLFAALTKLSTILLIAWLAKAPRVFYLFVGWMALWHSIFGFSSGIVSLGLLKSVGGFKFQLSSERENHKQEEA